MRREPGGTLNGWKSAPALSASAEARVGGDMLEVVTDPGHPRWLIGDTRALAPRASFSVSPGDRLLFYTDSRRDGARPQRHPRTRAAGRRRVRR